MSSSGFIFVILLGAFYDDNRDIILPVCAAKNTVIIEFNVVEVNYIDILIGLAKSAYVNRIETCIANNLRIAMEYNIILKTGIVPDKYFLINLFNMFHIIFSYI